MIKVGDLVKLDKKFYSITINLKKEKDLVGIVVKIDEGFYNVPLVGNKKRMNRCHVLFGEKISLEPESALIKIEDTNEDR